MARGTARTVPVKMVTNESGRTLEELSAEFSRCIEAREFDAAHRVFEELRRANPASEASRKAQRWVAGYYGSQKLREQERALLRDLIVAEEGPATDWGWVDFNRLVGSYRKEKRHERALQEVEKSAAEFESASETMRIRFRKLYAATMLDCGKVTEAEELLQRTIREVKPRIEGEAPEHTLAEAEFAVYDLLARIHNKRVTLETAIQDLQLFVERYPDLTIRAWAYADQEYL